MGEAGGENGDQADFCGILTHQLGAVSIIMTDRDTEALENTRKNVDYNLRQGGCH